MLLTPVVCTVPSHSLFGPVCYFKDSQPLLCGVCMSIVPLSVAKQCIPIMFTQSDYIHVLNCMHEQIHVHSHAYVYCGISKYNYIIMNIWLGHPNFQSPRISKHTVCVRGDHT